MSDVVLINAKDGIKRVMNNQKLYTKLLGKFKVDTNLSELEAAIAAGDMEKAKDSVHTLKGLAANLSLEKLSKHCLEVETQIKAASFNIDQLEATKNVYAQTLVEIDKVLEEYA